MCCVHALHVCNCICINTASYIDPQCVWQAMHLGTSFSFGCICQTCVKHNNNLDLQNERDNKNVSCMIDEYMRKRGRKREREECQ